MWVPRLVGVVIFVGALILLWSLGQAGRTDPEPVPQAVSVSAPTEAVRPAIAVGLSPQVVRTAAPEARPAQPRKQPKARRPGARVEGVVVDETGALVPGALVLVEQCGGTTVQRAGDGTFRIEVGLGDSCFVRAQRPESTTGSMSSPAVVHRGDGDLNEVVLVVPSQPTGEPGLLVRPGETGPTIASIVKASPAASADLAVGDLLLGVEGKRVASLDIDEVERRLGGPPGSVVTLRLGYEADDGRWVERDLEIERVVLQDPELLPD